MSSITFIFECSNFLASSFFHFYLVHFLRLFDLDIFLDVLTLLFINSFGSIENHKIFFEFTIRSSILLTVRRLILFILFHLWLAAFDNLEDLNFHLFFLICFGNLCWSIFLILSNFIKFCFKLSFDLLSIFVKILVHCFIDLIFF